MGIECEWRYARKRWAEDLGILKKTSVFGVDFRPCKSDNFLCHLGHRELSSLPWTREFGSQTIGSDYAVDKLKSDHGVLQISTDRDLKHYGMRSVFVGSDSTVSTVRILSLSSCRRTELRSQVINKRFVPEQWSPPVSAYVFAYVYVHWYWYDYGYTTF